jgi:hypothetical protein
VRAAPQVLHGVDAAEDGHVRHPERRLHGVDALDRALVVPVHLLPPSFFAGVVPGHDDRQEDVRDRRR